MDNKNIQKKKGAANPAPESESASLKNDPDGETVCSAYFSEGCVNIDEDTPVTSKEGKVIAD